MIRVFVGCAPNNEDAEAQAVLEYSIREHASEDVDITWMQLSNKPTSPFNGWASSKWPTPFSAFRWIVPELAGWQGKAIYTDSDVIFKADIAELYNHNFKSGNFIYARNANRLCVSLWDCQEAAKHLPKMAEFKSDPDNHLKLKRLVSKLSNRVECFPDNANWNCLDGEDEPDLNAPHIKAIHYTYMPTQPSVPHAIRRLKAEGRRHWFDGKSEVHWRKDLISMFDDKLAAAGSLDKYCSEDLFGDYPKQSLADMGRPTWSKMC